MSESPAPAGNSAAQPARTLLIDTATEHCAVALAIGPAVIEVEVEQVGNRHSQRALALVERLLARHHLAPHALTGFAFGAGPGSFTGLRIACGIVQGLALGTGRPVIGIGNLQALAAAAAPDRPQGALLVAIDARMDQVYWGVYDGRSLEERAPPALAARADLPQLIATWQPIRLVTDPKLPVADVGVPTAWPEPAALAHAMVWLAHQRLGAGEGTDAADATPLYVRDRVAATIADRRAASLAAEATR